MIVGSPEHKAHMRNEAQHHIEKAMGNVSDAGVFSEDQRDALRLALWDVFNAITKTI